MRRLVFAVLAILPGSAFAAGGEASGVIEEVVVTAEKRQSTVQDTPIAITAYDTEMLDLRGIDELEDLQFSAPNLVISPNSQSPVTYAYIRGIGSDQLVAGFDPGVAYHVDGLYVGQPSAMPGDMWDMTRVEVLRGPQGTLYGRNTTGGSINLITAEPTADFTAFGDITLGNYDRRRVRGVINGGNETVAGRLSFIADKDDGYQDNLIGGNGDETDHHSIRGKLKIALSDNAEVLLTAQRFENNGRNSQKKREGFAGLPVYAGAIPNPSDPRKIAKDRRERLDLENTLLSGRLTVDFENFSLVAITGYIENEWFQNADIDMSSNPIQYQNWDMETDQFSQEIQLVSNGDGPWQWIAGVFFFTEDLETSYLFEDTSPFGFLFMNGGEIETESQAVFGQLSYDFSDGGLPLRVTAGLRWTEDEKDIDEYQQIPLFGVDFAGRMSESWDEVSGKLGLDWFINEDTMAYVNFSRGYKGGGYSIGQFDVFDPETVDSVEIGLKSQFMNDRARVNVSAFYNDYQDLQVNFLVFTSFTTDNAAEATIQGLEVETTFIPVDNLTLSANFTWLDAEFDRYQFTPAISLDGDTLNRAPEFTYALSAQYEWFLGDAGSLLARADYYWQDEVYYRVQNIPRHMEESFGTADARLIWRSADDQWSVDVFGKNLTDEDNQRGLTVSDGLSTGNNSFETYYPPRTYGVTFGWRLAP
ncbi:MAG: TonB-dependent receptor [Pseudomonadales bacterium]